MDTSKLKAAGGEGAELSSLEAKVASRISELVEKVGGEKAAADIAGKSADQIRRYAKMKSAAPLEPIARLAKAAGYSLDWVVGTDVERGALPYSFRKAQPDVGREMEEGEEYVALPRYDVAAAAGAGAVVDTEEILGLMLFRKGWLRNTLGLTPQQLALIEAVGDSMSPTIQDGDILLLDTSEPKLRGDGIYVLGEGEMLLVKRVTIRLGGRGISVTSDNDEYAGGNLELAAEELGDIRIIGRVVWVGGRI